MSVDKTIVQDCVDKIKDFSRECEQNEYTDTGDMWMVMHEIQDALIEALNEGSKWEVQTRLTDGSWWVCWYEDDQPLYFDSEEEAEAAIDEFFEGFPPSMKPSYDRENYRVRKVD